METPEIAMWSVLGILSLIQIAPIKINPWSWLGRAIGRAINGELIEEVKEVKKKVDKLENSIDENEAKSARVRILRFGDELYQGNNHSKEHFDNILADITDYNSYCREHKEFVNERTKATEDVILEQYHEHCINKTFLERKGG